MRGVFIANIGFLDDAIRFKVGVGLRDLLQVAPDAPDNRIEMWPN